MKRGLYAVLFSGLLTCNPPPVQPVLPLTFFPEVKTPLEARMWLDKNLDYKHDQELYKVEEFWASCAVTYQNGAGDCDDHAICAATLLAGDVEEGNIISLNYPQPSKKKGHAVLVYRIGQYWGIISNNTLEFSKPKYTSIHQAIVELNNAREPEEQYPRYFIYDYSTVDIAAGAGNLKPKMTKIGEYKLK